MIVDCAVYEDGARCEGDLPLTEAGAAAQRDGSFVWLGVYEPSEEEFDAVRREFDLHELAVEDAVDAHQRPKVERYGDTLLVVVKTVRYTGRLQNVETGEILLFVNRDFVVTVRHGRAALHDPSRFRSAARISPRTGASPARPPSGSRAGRRRPRRGRR